MAHVIAAPIDMEAAGRFDAMWVEAEDADMVTNPSTMIVMAASWALAHDIRRVSRVLFRVVCSCGTKGLPLWWAREKFHALGLPALAADAIERHFSEHRMVKLIDGHFRHQIRPGDWQRLAAEKTA